MMVKLKQQIYSVHSSLSKPAAYITHKATQPPPVQSGIQVCYARRGL